MKLSDEQKENVLIDLKGMVGENDIEYEVPENYRKIPFSEIKDYVETIRELIRIYMAIMQKTRRIMIKYLGEQ